MCNTPLIIISIQNEEETEKINPSRHVEDKMHVKMHKLCSALRTIQV